MIRKGLAYVHPDGSLTDAGYFALNGLERAVSELTARLDAAALVADAAGGGTVDAEARAELVAIKAALG
jgi:hypothetical protein